jgi:hypothetical protein
MEEEMMKAARLTFVVLLALFLFACSSRSEDRMVGKWQQVDGTQVMQFFNNGTLIVSDRGKSMDGVYKILSDGRVRLEIGDPSKGVNMLWEVSVSPNELSFSAPTGKLLRFRKEQ